MIAPNREIANINSFTNTSSIFNLTDFNNISEDIQMGAPRGRSIIVSTNTFKRVVHVV